MSISKDNEEHDCCAEETCEHRPPEVITLDLRDIMKEIEASGNLPDGFVMVYMLADPAESEDNSQTDFFFRAFAESRGFIHKKTVLMYQDIPITRHELAWFGEWNLMADNIEATESEVKDNLLGFLENETLRVMPRMDFMFVNQPKSEELVASEDDVF